MLLNSSSPNRSASFLDFLAVSDALGIQIQEGRFVAVLTKVAQMLIEFLRKCLKVVTIQTIGVPCSKRQKMKIIV